MENDLHHHIENDPEYKGLKVNSGIQRPETVDGESVKRFLSKRKKLLSVEEYVDGVLNGDITF